MNETLYKARYEQLRLRAVNDPESYVGFGWFRELKRRLDDLSRVMLRDNRLSRAAKRRLTDADQRVFGALVRRLHAAYSALVNNSDV